MNRNLLGALCGAACAALVAAAGANAQTVAITGGTVYPVSGPAIQNGTVLIRDGKIVAVGADVAVPAGAQRIDATGKLVTPGLIDASTQLGLTVEQAAWLLPSKAKHTGLGPTAKGAIAVTSKMRREAGGGSMPAGLGKVAVAFALGYFFI